MEIDYIVAVGIFVIIFATAVGSVASMLVANQEASQAELRHIRASGLLEWAKMNLTGTVYRVIAHANGNSDNELFVINLSDFVYDRNSVVFYKNGRSLQYSRIGDVYSAVYNASDDSNLEVWFDDDSSFSDRSTAVIGEDRVLEQTWPAEQVEILEWKRIVALNNSDYNIRRQQLGYRFQIKLEPVLSWGEQPAFGAVVLQQPVLWQDSTGEIRKGLLVASVW
jgi:hypothetical protein